MKTKTKVVCGSVAAAVTLAVQVGCKQGVTDEPLEVVSVKNAERGSVLQELARQTGGQYYGGLTNAMDSRFAMEEAYAQIADRTLFLKGTVVPAQVKRNNKETGTLSPERIRVPFLVDSFIRRLDVTVGYFGGEEEASLVLQKPDGSTITPHISPTPDGLTMLDFIVHDSLAGEWAIVGTRKPGTRIEYFAYITTSGGPYLSWLAMEESPDGGEYLIVVALRGDVSIEGAKVVGEIKFDSGETETCVFSKNHVAIYGAEYRPKKSGHARVTVTASNPDGAAFYTWRDAQIHHFEGDDTTPPKDVKIKENFIRTVSERVHVKARR